VSGSTDPVLSIRDLKVRFDVPEGIVRAVDGVSYDVGPGEILGVVGESGCGKSVTVMAALGLLAAPPARVVGGEVLLEGRDLLRLGPKELRAVRGKDVAMVFQDPMTSLHPAYTVGAQVAEAVRAHEPRASARAAEARAVDLLRLVGVPDAGARAPAYPHQWSGGMRQRAMIAMAIAHRPKVLIADEPTTALDVTVQAQVLEVLRRVQEETGSAIVLITHDLGVIAEMADRVVVMYAGRVVETGGTTALFRAARHPYTRGLLACLPRLELEGKPLPAIPGSPPDLVAPPPGCAFHPRCGLRQGRHRCAVEEPVLAEVGEGHRAACHFSDELGDGRAPAAALEPAGRRR
jgi:oligopeptide/dipeptide ABC transporter ATP-binding protein